MTNPLYPNFVDTLMTVQKNYNLSTKVITKYKGKVFYNRLGTTSTYQKWISGTLAGRAVFYGLSVFYYVCLFLLDVCG